jgi:probable phosphomutase (TIGR03848 family)
MAAPGSGRTPTVVLLVRHARTATTGKRLPGRAPGLVLSPAGRREAEALAGRLAGVPGLAAVYSSPLERARETAAAIARPRRLAVRIARDLIELDVGRWTGLALRAARKRPEWATVQRHPSGFRFPDGESFTDMQARVVAAIGQLVARHAGQTVVAVSHADPIKAALAHALGIPLDLFQRLVVAPASVSAVAYGPAGPTVLTTNATGDGLGPFLAR